MGGEMSDTGEAVSDAESLQEAVNAVRGKDGKQIIIVQRAARKEDGFSKFKDVIFVAVVLAMGAAVWNNSISQATINAKLETTVESLQRTVAELTIELKALRDRIK